MNRIRYLIILIVILFLCTENVFSQAGKKLFPETPGMVSYTYRNSFSKDVSATLDTIQALGITDMEFSSLFGKTAPELRKLLDERGIKCTSFGVGYDDLVNNTSEVARNAKTLGASFVRVAWIPHEAPFNIADAKRAVADFNRIGEILNKDHGLTFAYRNHGYEFRPYGEGTLFDYIVQNTDPEYVSFEMDILWVVHPGANPVELLNRYGERFKLMHLKDLRKGVKGDLSGSTAKDNDVALGTGQIDIPAVLHAAKKAGVEHFYIEDESEFISVQVPQTIAYINSINIPLFPETPGLVSYTYRHSFAKDVSATLDTIEALGIRDIEFSSLFGKTASELREQLDERGIKCSSFGVGYNDIVNKTAEVARNAKILGASFVRVASIPHEDSFDLNDAQKAVSDFNRVGKILKEEHGLTFAYHNHGYEFRPYGEGTLFDYIVQNTNPKYVSFEMDILWVVHPGATDPVELLNKYGKRFKLMHLKDLRKGVKGDFSGSTAKNNDVALGMGQIDIPAILRAANKAGVQHYYIEDESDFISVQVPETMAYLRSLEE